MVDATAVPVPAVRVASAVRVVSTVPAGTTVCVCGTERVTVAVGTAVRDGAGVADQIAVRVPCVVVAAAVVLGRAVLPASTVRVPCDPASDAVAAAEPAGSDTRATAMDVPATTTRASMHSGRTQNLNTCDPFTTRSAAPRASSPAHASG